uniref:Uncharacterized protein n=1 Tax=Anguilla anguilla TaxID=7936 RepID=A0A0E9TQ31_ANGAN
MHLFYTDSSHSCFKFCETDQASKC